MFNIRIISDVDKINCYLTNEKEMCEKQLPSSYLCEDVLYLIKDERMSDEKIKSAFNNINKKFPKISKYSGLIQLLYNGIVLGSICVNIVEDGIQLFNYWKTMAFSTAHRLSLCNDLVYLDLYDTLISEFKKYILL
jgi:hypothetical protein